MRKYNPHFKWTAKRVEDALKIMQNFPHNLSFGFSVVAENFSTPEASLSIKAVQQSWYNKNGALYKARHTKKIFGVTSQKVCLLNGKNSLRKYPNNPDHPVIKGSTRTIWYKIKEIFGI